MTTSLWGDQPVLDGATQSDAHRLDRQADAAVLAVLLPSLFVLTAAAFASGSVALGALLVLVAIETWLIAKPGATRPALAGQVLLVYALGHAALAVLLGHHPRAGVLVTLWCATVAGVLFLIAHAARSAASDWPAIVPAVGSRALLLSAATSIVLVGLLATAVAGWWWADLAAGVALGAWFSRRP